MCACASVCVCVLQKTASDTRVDTARRTDTLCCIRSLTHGWIRRAVRTPCAVSAAELDQLLPGTPGAPLNAAANNRSGAGCGSSVRRDIRWGRVWEQGMP